MVRPTPVLCLEHVRHQHRKRWKHSTGISITQAQDQPFWVCYQNTVRNFEALFCPIRSLQSLANVRGTSLDRSDLSALQKHCQTIIIIADVSEELAVQIERRTRGQHTSSLWFAARAGRITDSSMHSVYATDISSLALTTIKRVYYPPLGPGTATTSWGIKQEETARQAYTTQTKEQQRNQQVQTCGFFVNLGFPQVGASPDAIVSCTCCGKGCIEVKCPA